MKKKIDEEDFFDESEIKKAGRHAEEMDTSFVEPKKHHFFAGFLVFLLLVIIGGACAYYFVLDTPKKTYTTIVEKLTKDNVIVSSNTNKDMDYNYSLSANIISNNKETQKVLDVINKLQISGTTNYNSDILTGKNNIKYKDKELLDITYKLNSNDAVLYLKLNKVLDKVIKIDSTKEEVGKDLNKKKDSYTKLIKQLIYDFKLSLENANYERKITKLNNSFVFKETLFLDQTLSKELLTKLLHDDEFLQYYAEYKDASISEVSDELNEELANIDDEVSTISVYKTIIKNDIIKVEAIDEDSNITINKEDNKYSFEIVDENELIYKGYLKVDNQNSETKLAFNLELIKEKMSFEINATYSKNTNSIEGIDTNNAINYQDLTEDDLSKVVEYIKENEAVKSLIEDLNLTETLEEITTM